MTKQTLSSPEHLSLSSLPFPIPTQRVLDTVLWSSPFPHTSCCSPCPERPSPGFALFQDLPTLSPAPPTRRICPSLTHGWGFNQPQCPGVDFISLAHRKHPQPEHSPKTQKYTAGNKHFYLKMEAKSLEYKSSHLSPRSQPRHLEFLFFMNKG